MGEGEEGVSVGENEEGVSVGEEKGVLVSKRCQGTEAPEVIGKLSFGTRWDDMNSV